MGNGLLDYLNNQKPLERKGEGNYLRQMFPKIYGAMGGLLGTAPDEFQGSVLDPLSAQVRQGAEMGYLPGLLASGAPPMKGAAGLGALAGFGGIVSPKVAAGLKTVKNLPIDDLFRQAVANTPGASVGDDGLRMMLQRNQMPEQAMSPSVRGGVFYLPEGAAQGKHYSTGKNGYGGREKIAGETLIKNPLFVKGATGGKAPEAAFDQLMGKGAYQTMRTDALKAYGGYGASPSQKVAQVQRFLDKYAPELSDQADYIVDNSKQGNQLAYALQEAAAGSAVRKAGHDVVLGHSKGKSGPFLSEVFDLREKSYPNAVGGSDIWDSYTGQPMNQLQKFLK